ncbi:taste receptor type 2 member 40-like [Aquarana catesbeiana]|uniref:taste receptor type 2 member 40-like n=1 Tax=Aquarana catesbeiana TaxID=8400 RepID=UPI003CCA6C3B
MLSPVFLSMLVCSVLGLGLAIPSYTCIVMGNLDIIRKKEKLSPTDVIFLAKGIVNILLQCVLSLQGMIYVLYLEILYIRSLYAFVNTSMYFLMYYSFWLTFWLSAHYCTSITNLSYGFFMWLKRIVSNFLSQLLFLTALGMFILSVPGFWTVYAESIQSSENSTEDSVIRFHLSLPYFVAENTLGCILPFCLSLLCLVLTFSFLLRHVWRVKNNDSGSTRPNLQAHVTALRTIFFLLLIFTFFCMSQVFTFLQKFTEITLVIPAVIWNLRLLSPSVEAAVIFQASNKLRRIILRRFWTRSWRNTET